MLSGAGLVYNGSASLFCNWSELCIFFPHYLWCFCCSKIYIYRCRELIFLSYPSIIWKGPFNNQIGRLSIPFSSFISTFTFLHLEIRCIGGFFLLLFPTYYPIPSYSECNQFVCKFILYKNRTHSPASHIWWFSTVIAVGSIIIPLFIFFFFCIFALSHSHIFLEFSLLFGFFFFWLFVCLFYIACPRSERNGLARLYLGAGIV